MRPARENVRHAITRLLPQPRLVCIGHSHIRAVIAAAQLQRVPLTALDFWVTGEPTRGEDGQLRMPADMAEQLTGKVFSMVGGAAFNIMGLCVHPRRFDFVLPSASGLPIDARAELVPYAAVRTALLDMTRKYLAMMGVVRDAARGHVYQIEAPPPFIDDGRMLKDVYWPDFEDKRREISPHYLRYKLWRLHSEIVQEFCAQRGIMFIARPAEAVDQDGFLLPQFYADPMHVNAAYGALVLAQMRSVT